jgi:hypothetical protein
MNLALTLAIFVAWTAVGIVAAYLFGRFVRATDTPEDVTELPPPVVTYLRPRKRTNSSRVQVAPGAQRTARRAAAAGNR